MRRRAAACTHERLRAEPHRRADSDDDLDSDDDPHVDFDSDSGVAFDRGGRLGGRRDAADRDRMQDGRGVRHLHGGQRRRSMLPEVHDVQGRDQGIAREVPRGMPVDVRRKLRDTTDACGV